jgi:hypothetical protein
MGKGYKGKNPGRGGRGGGGDAQPAQKWRKSKKDESSSEEEPGSEPEGEEAPKREEVNTRGAPGELPPNSSDEEEESESDSDSDDELLNPHKRAPRTKVEEPVVEKSQKELEADMDKLRLVRERRAAQAAERIANEGFDRFAPPGSANGPPLPKK